MASMYGSRRRCEAIGEVGRFPLHSLGTEVEETQLERPKNSPQQSLSDVLLVFIPSMSKYRQEVVPGSMYTDITGGPVLPSRSVVPSRIMCIGSFTSAAVSRHS